MIEIKQGNYKDLVKNITNKSVNLVITDPPYWHKKSPGKPYSQRKAYNTESKFANSKIFHAESEVMAKMSDFDGNEVEILMNEIKRVMIKMNAYIFCNDTLLPYYGMWAEKNKYHFSVLVWEKPLSIINKNRFSQHLEYIVRIYEYGTALNKIEEENNLYSKVKRYSQVRGNTKLHPTQKPVELIKEIIKVSSNTNDFILDLFAGSFSTGIACLDLNRKCIGFELDENYFKISEERIKKALEEKRKEKDLQAETLFENEM
jgi:DNA modification methylase